MRYYFVFPDTPKNPVRDRGEEMILNETGANVTLTTCFVLDGESHNYSIAMHQKLTRMITHSLMWTILRNDKVDNTRIIVKSLDH